MYAIVKTGGKQYRVAVGDVVTVEKLDLALGASVALPAILLVDGEDVTTDATALAAVSVTGEILAQVKGPKIKIHKFKNKTGYHKRMGHRQKLTEVKIISVSTTAASTATAAPVESAEPADATPTATSEEN